MKKWAIVCTGGGAAGCEPVGALKAIFGAGLRPDFMVGTSVGAINVAVASYNNGDVSGLEQMWRSIKSADDVFSGKFWIQLPWSTGAKTMAPLEKKLHALIDGKKPQIPFHVAVTEMISHQSLLVSESDPDIFNMTIASGRIPGYVESYIPNSKVCYCDGGVLLNNGLPAAISEGAEVVVILHTRMEDPSIGDPWKPGNPLDQFVRGFELCDERLYNDQEKATAAGVQVINLWAGANDIGALDFKPDLMALGLNRGDSRAQLRLSEIAQAIQ